MFLYIRLPLCRCFLGVPKHTLFASQKKINLGLSEVWYTILFFFSQAIVYWISYSHFWCLLQEHRVSFLNYWCHFGCHSGFPINLFAFLVHLFCLLFRFSVYFFCLHFHFSVHNLHYLAYLFQRFGAHLGFTSLTCLFVVKPLFTKKCMYFYSINTLYCIKKHLFCAIRFVYWRKISNIAHE